METKPKYVLWGKHENRAEDWHEEVLLSEATAEQCDLVEKMAANGGWGHFRRVLLDDSPPDFTACVRIER